MNNRKFDILYLALFCTIMLFVISCKKKDSIITVSGKVINPGTGSTISEASVSLASTSIQAWVYNSNFQDIDQMNSESDGTFSFSFKEQAAGAYRIYIYKNNYFTTTEILDADEVNEGSLYKVFELYPESEVALHITNSSPVDSADRILFRVLKGCVSCTGGCNSDYHMGWGENFDTTFTCKTHGDFYFVVESNITKNGFTQMRMDSVYAHPFTETPLNINY